MVLFRIITLTCYAALIGAAYIFMGVYFDLLERLPQ